ncbi:hypothetical protein BU17DRAFT_101027 [Hysterangium stoloniferum]|nr:hypothetical protein BU17DRAFT_101027 [Hysterangium stoloniferum]
MQSPPPPYHPGPVTAPIAIPSVQRRYPAFVPESLENLIFPISIPSNPPSPPAMTPPPLLYTFPTVPRHPMSIHEEEVTGSSNAPSPKRKSSAPVVSPASPPPHPLMHAELVHTYQRPHVKVIGFDVGREVSSLHQHLLAQESLRQLANARQSGAPQAVAQPSRVQPGASEASRGRASRSGTSGSHVGSGNFGSSASGSSRNAQRSTRPQGRRWLRRAGDRE